MKYVLTVYLPGLILGSFATHLALQQGTWPVVLILWLMISGLGIAAGYHRVYSHKTHELKPWLDNLILVLGALGGQGSSISWVAVHRGYHHKHSDTERDLHSPHNGIMNALIGWYWKLRPETINNKYAIDLLRRPNHVWFHRNYLRILVSLIILATIIPYGYIYLSALFLSLCQDNLVNLLCHLRPAGYRNFDTKDNSVNVPFLGYFGFGQGWHNNHHNNPSAYNFGVKWWEVDLSRIFLPLLRLGSTKIRSTFVTE